MKHSIPFHLHNAAIIYTEYSAPPLTITINPHGFSDPLLKSVLGEWYLPGSVIEFARDKVTWYINGEFFRASQLAIVERLADPRFVAFVLRGSRVHGKRLTRIVQTIRRMHGSAPSRNSRLATELVSEMKAVCAYGYIPPASDICFFTFTHALEEMVEQARRAYHLRRPVKEYLSVLTSPTALTSALRYERAILQEAKAAGRRPISPRTLQRLAGEFFALRYGHYGPELTVADIEKDIQDVMAKGNVARRLRALENDHRVIGAKQKKFERELHLDARSKRLLRTARKSIVIKAYRLDVLSQGYAAMDHLLSLHPPGIRNRKFFRWLTVPEFITYLRTGRHPSERELERRYTYMTYTVSGPHRYELRVGAEARRYLKQFALRGTHAEKERVSVHGSVACSGRARGTVRVVNTPRENAKVQEGDILVATQTTPDLIPAMKKAAAFVTDVGGITSHASIVSREMKKPCIIGTKFATQVFKDGDEVIVDAHKGMVYKV